MEGAVSWAAQQQGLGVLHSWGPFNWSSVTNYWAIINQFSGGDRRSNHSQLAEQCATIVWGAWGKVRVQIEAALCPWALLAFILSLMGVQWMGEMVVSQHTSDCFGQLHERAHSSNQTSIWSGLCLKVVPPSLWTKVTLPPPSCSFCTTSFVSVRFSAQRGKQILGSEGYQAVSTQTLGTPHPTVVYLCPMQFWLPGAAMTLAWSSQGQWLSLQ